MFFPERIRSIGPADTVLEIGPGGAPHPRSDVFLEKRFGTPAEASGQRGFAPSPADPTMGEKTVFYDGGPFPFADKAFDYVICSHVLEHVEDVDAFASELTRVGRKGYIEFPTVYYDYLYDFPEHVTLLFERDGVVRWMPKGETRLSEFRPVTAFFYESFEKGHNDLVEGLKSRLFQGFEWQGAVKSERTASLMDLTYRRGGVPARRRDGRCPGGSPEMPRPPAGGGDPAAPVRRAAPAEKAGAAASAPRSPRGGRLGSWVRFAADYREFRRKAAADPRDFDLRWKNRMPCLSDRTAATGFDRHYVYHTAWAARVLALTRPAEHIDVSSSLYFCAIASAFVPMRHVDFRPPNLALDNLSVGPASLLALPFADGEVKSLSCMHVVEHVGLGRYGDPLDPGGDLKAMSELSRVLAPGGSLLFAVPVGRPSIVFNAHRIYSREQVVRAFPGLALEEFALVPDSPADGGLVRGAAPQAADAQRYGCGCFWFRRTA